jgi:hypothetical protein
MTGAIILLLLYPFMDWTGRSSKDTERFMTEGRCELLAVMTKAS